MSSRFSERGERQSLWWTKARGLAVGFNGGDSLSEIGRSVRRSPEQMLVGEEEDREKLKENPEASWW
ncbi:hypothetical protein DEO72_LG1g2032 [Vigna unguiculata]|uniref:Uncharacterized protein n=1 Tax=Vigna unguiculata TaxID=3917 RepID=A0A4D6KLH4_VIGUN|nr:hypothetical protein DEO72_LG1g2031 [Vigna unguiculata]QCD78399.1 hypothetical protein DEO72_LG1g2032 [Vigna unguiculata]